MKIFSALLSLILFCCAPFLAFAQPCDANTEVTVKVTIGTDMFPYEYSWDLVGLDGTVYREVALDATYQSETVYDWEVCLPIGKCATFTIYDSYGDGMEAPGFYALAVNGVEVENSVLEADKASFAVNCGVGLACNSAEVVNVGLHEAAVDNAWYAFTPENSGQYRIGTCNLTTCDTKIWIFSDCVSAHNDEGNEGTLAFDDNFGNCGEQANITSAFAKDVTVYIRIGDDNDACGGGAIAWEIDFIGAIEGCTDPSSCNYSPLATVDDGSCLPFGDPGCPEAPDLVIRQDVLTSTAYLDKIDVTDECLIEEGCLNGYGMRDILRFSTYIENNGDADYFIGTPGVDDSQFTYDNCHNHWHYDGYAEYVLYGSNGQEIPIGFKNGFCVIDLGCTTGTAQYNCDFMGITVGCYDEYWAELDCQWIDITDVPDGRYTFVTRVNWDNAPDAFGRVEKDTLNNWAQMCIILDRSSGSLQFTQDENCDDFIDCNGVVFGDAQFDCEGVCEGTAIWGDLNLDGEWTTTDADSYLNGLVSGSLAANSCNDLNGDGEITLYDVALMVNCALYGEEYQNPNGGIENHCEFPYFLLNPNHTVGLTILANGFDENYIDIGIRNTSANVLGYQFYMTGINIIGVENLVDPQMYPITPQHGNDGMIIGLSMNDSLLLRSNEWKPLVRVYHDGSIFGEVCISDNREIIKEGYELTHRYILDGCITLSSVANLNERLAISVFPNPFATSTRLRFANPEGASYELRISDVSGKVVQTIAEINGNEVLIEAGDMAKGLYLYQLIGEEGIATGKLMIE